MQKTPDKEKSSVVSEKTPEKSASSTEEGDKDIFTPTKETEKSKSPEFLTPEKTARNPALIHEPPEEQNNKYKTPEKKEKFSNPVQVISLDEEDEMMSTAEQARLLIAASKTPSKSLNRTPAKQKTPSGKRSIESSPGTPGKYRRVELITLASPKAKLIQEFFE